MSETTPIHLPKTSESERLKRIRHTASHVMAMAVQRLFPKAKVTIGPWIEDGFYYDFDHPEPFTEQDLKAIKKEMVKIIKKKLPVIREEVSREEALRRIQALNEPYKLEILADIKEEPITIYHLGDEWWDLCAGPHLDNVGELNPDAIELESVAGAYWRGDERNPMLQRIYGTAWETPEQLQAYLQRKREALRRDHRRLGQELDLFSIQEEAGGGLVFWHPKGARMRLLIENYWREAHLRAGYELLYTPHLAHLDLWKTSGHWDFYRESMFDAITVESQEYQLKPMNCPFHVLTYKTHLHSYRELPIRYAELGTVYRYERSGTLHGLMRVRGFTQDDAHIFCLPEQVADEILGVLNLTEQVLSDFGFRDYEVNLSTRPEKSVGSDEVWELATNALRNALDTKGWAYKEDVGGGAFYGPKIDIKIRDAIGRLWQCSTVQVDFNLPQRFGLEYVAADGSRQVPIMIHRAIFGSLERFFGVLIEHYAGDFPLWLAPVQLRFLPVGEQYVSYAKNIATDWQKLGLRVEVDTSGERLGKLIRNAETAKIPVMAIVGSKEQETGTLSIRTRHGGDLGALTVAEAEERLLKAVQQRCDF
ncbi:MAG: threonine--tRNA ligase [Gloeomargarita sp. SKYG116]|nr:threonine--tRNA ligase [Gloeomargarita sp. SKYG116]MCS7293541.1 threonine--tRNA ligase [Gloeomargarita sp. SKYB120]MDW8179107.1 threonine--tRNA ligase [Gloeomargarita sp. SKYBB_i_bin120]MDW8401204.1 threonine--tRNA ligase [Gloeomargarita sp. SKYGB_i_bin116]